MECLLKSNFPSSRLNWIFWSLVLIEELRCESFLSSSYANLSEQKEIENAWRIPQQTKTCKRLAWVWGNACVHRKRVKDVMILHYQTITQQRSILLMLMSPIMLQLFDSDEKSSQTQSERSDSMRFFRFPLLVCREFPKINLCFSFPQNESDKVFSSLFARCHATYTERTHSFRWQGGPRISSWLFILSSQFFHTPRIVIV